MTKKKKSSGALGKVVAGASLAAAAGAAAVLANKKTRKQVEARAKKAVARIKSDPKVKEISHDTADLLRRISEGIKNFFK